MLSRCPWAPRHALGLRRLPAADVPRLRRRRRAAPPVTVQTVLPKHGEIARTITLPSFRILAYQEATLYAKVSGYLKTLTVDKGDAVKEGQLLAEIEVPELLADEAQYKAETAVSRTNYERMAEARTKRQTWSCRRRWTTCGANGKWRKPNCNGPRRCCNMPGSSRPSPA